MKDYIKILQENNLLKVIDTPCSTELEIAHLSYLEVKKPDSKALLFTNPVDKNGKKYEMPV
ncbi:MAG: UbiD family decarboxylase, partial [Campylobacter sp.]